MTNHPNRSRAAQVQQAHRISIATFGYNPALGRWEEGGEGSGLHYRVCAWLYSKSDNKIHDTRYIGQRFPTAEAALRYAKSIAPAHLRDEIEIETYD